MYGVSLHFFREKIICALSYSCTTWDSDSSLVARSGLALPSAMAGHASLLVPKKEERMFWRECARTKILFSHHHEVILADNNISIKRRRDSAVDSPSICLSDLPSGILGQVADFLAAPSRALFAVALNSRDSSAITGGNQLEVLDFGDIETELAAKLSNDDISAVLLCIDAVNNLKRLRMTNCINITGAGLEPLRGSTIYY